MELRLWCCVSREAPFEAPAVSHVVNTIISLLSHFPSFSLLFCKKGQFTVATIPLCQTKKGNKKGEKEDLRERVRERKRGGERGREREMRGKVDWDRGRERQSYRARKKSARAAHKLYTVKQKKGAPQLLPKYAQRTGMQHGALCERNKDSTVSGSLSPVLPHPHIISWKIPDICCNFFSFFSSSSSSCRCWYRQGFNIQMPVRVCVCTCTMHTLISTPFSQPGTLPKDHRQLIYWIAEECVCFCGAHTGKPHYVCDGVYVIVCLQTITTM